MSDRMRRVNLIHLIGIGGACLFWVRRRLT